MGAGDLGVQDDGDGHHLRVHERLLEFSLGIRDQASGIELPARQRRGDDDHPHLGPPELRAHRLAVGPRLDLEGVEPDQAIVHDAVLDADLHDLDRIDHRTAADGHEQVCPGFHGRPRRFGDVLARGVLRDAVIQPRKALARRGLYLGAGLGLFDPAARHGRPQR
jgi:hypothetical protein